MDQEVNVDRTPLVLESVKIWFARIPRTDSTVLVHTVLGERAARQHACADRRCPLTHGGRCDSLSHATGLTALAVSDAVVGVDLERVLAARALPDLSWALTDAEREEVPADARRLTEVWTAKEAAGKANGTGLAGAPAAIGTAAVPDRPDWRSAELADGRMALTCGRWMGAHHVRVAWFPSVGGA